MKRGRLDAHSDPAMVRADAMPSWLVRRVLEAGAALMIGSAALAAVTRSEWANYGMVTPDSIAPFGPFAFVLFWFGTSLIGCGIYAWARGGIAHRYNLRNAAFGGSMAIFGATVIFAVGFWANATLVETGGVGAFIVAQAAIVQPHAGAEQVACDAGERAVDATKDVTVLDAVLKKSLVSQLNEFGCISDAEYFESVSRLRQAAAGLEPFSARLPYLNNVRAVNLEMVRITAWDWCVKREFRAGASWLVAYEKCAAEDTVKHIYVPPV